MVQALWLLWSLVMLQVYSVYTVHHSTLQYSILSLIFIVLVCVYIEMNVYVTNYCVSKHCWTSLFSAYTDLQNK